MYLIWSNEHLAWWRTASKGYSSNIKDAGLYSLEEARQICNMATHDWAYIPNEIPVLLSSLPDRALNAKN